jgi:hypothetical protein
MANNDDLGAWLRGIQPEPPEPTAAEIRAKLGPQMSAAARALPPRTAIEVDEQEMRELFGDDKSTQQLTYAFQRAGLTLSFLNLMKKFIVSWAATDTTPPSGVIQIPENFYRPPASWPRPPPPPRSTPCPRGGCAFTTYSTPD